MLGSRAVSKLSDRGKAARDSGWLGQLPRDLSLSGGCTSGSIQNHGKKKLLLLFGLLEREGEKKKQMKETTQERNSHVWETAVAV